MARENYKAEQLWLNGYFEHVDIFDLGMEAEFQMRQSGVTLPEVLDVLANGDVEWADRHHEGCAFVISGRNCDDEEIKICGGFNSGIEMVSVMRIEKAR
ncbi:hypothetical protein [uncultured Tateyamaria sp.]|uniref:hypothetical protein n=1 Tax=uncultured Tateyamaria sp. TaxID=455651 RepID=UPI0026122F00|nr:hypothetical protein [uncultured Tateyamaria sp.]